MNLRIEGTFLCIDTLYLPLSQVLRIQEEYTDKKTVVLTLHFPLDKLTLTFPKSRGGNYAYNFVRYLSEGSYSLINVDMISFCVHET